MSSSSYSISISNQDGQTSTSSTTMFTVYFTPFGFRGGATAQYRPPISPDKEPKSSTGCLEFGKSSDELAGC